MERPYTIGPLIPAGAKIAMVNIVSIDPGSSELAAEDLTMLLVNGQKFIVVDRTALDAVRKEQNFQTVCGSRC